MSYRSVFAPGLFAGQTHVVTGGGSGIGRCIAHELAALGSSVALVGRNPDKLKTVVAEIAEAGGKAEFHACDIREEEEVGAVVAEIVSRHGRIDGLVNNAGGQYKSDIRDIKAKGWRAVVDNNLTGGFIFSKQTYLQWMEAHGGSIVNIIADIWGGWPGWAHSGAARAGMLSFTESAACEWAQAGVRVNAVAPGWVASTALDRYDEELRANLRRWREEVPLKRFASVSEISAVVVFLLTPGASFVTGSCIRADGGVPNARPWYPLGPARNVARYDGFHLDSEPDMLAGE